MYNICATYQLGRVQINGRLDLQRDVNRHGAPREIQRRLHAVEGILNRVDVPFNVNKLLGDFLHDKLTHLRHVARNRDNHVVHDGSYTHRPRHGRDVVHSRHSH